MFCRLRNGRRAMAGLGIKTKQNNCPRKCLFQTIIKTTFDRFSSNWGLPKFLTKFLVENSSPQILGANHMTCTELLLRNYIAATKVAPENRGGWDGNTTSCCHPRQDILKSAVALQCLLSLQPMSPVYSSLPSATTSKWGSPSSYPDYQSLPLL